MTDRNLDPRRPGALNQYLTVAYADGRTPGADSLVYELFNSTTDRSLHSLYADGSAVYSDFRRYILSIKNSQAGTFKGYTSPDRGQTWVQYYEVVVPLAATTTFNNIVVPVEPHPDVKYTWTNGGAAQTTWVVFQALDGEEGSLQNQATGSGANVIVTNFPASQAVTVAQLPSSKGLKTNSDSLSITTASDSVAYAAASIRAPTRSEVLAIPVTTSSVTYDIPDATLSGQPDYRGKFIDFYAEGCTVYIQVSSSTSAAVDDTAVSVTASSSGGRFSVKPAATPSEPFVIPVGQWRSYPLPATGTFAIKGTGTGKLRTAISQT
ncbi:MAG: hypothetical protein JWO15_3696 [Sphingomonadales bacterium]|nr:hypothetical protein [Sphingomonadales bacterium]